jgi:hypothetical protein
LKKKRHCSKHGNFFPQRRRKMWPAIVMPTTLTTYRVALDSNIIMLSKVVKTIKIISPKTCKYVNVTWG